jgi:hypothetical protein
MRKIILIVICFTIFQSCSVNSQSDSLSVSGIYPHMAVFNDQFEKDEGFETGIGAVVHWADRLWAITYSAHKPMGSGDKLYEIDNNLNMIIRPESIGGTPANRLIHRESNQLIIGPYFVDQNRNVRVIPYEKMPGRLTATAPHLADPLNKVYFMTMEEGLYEVDIHSLNVKEIFKDRNTRGAPDVIPGYHAKGGYCGQERLVVSNNGDPNWRDSDQKASGVLAEWNGEKWSVIEKKQFVEVTGPGGIYGNTKINDPIWATGWDEKSVILKLLDNKKWYTFRLPKASFTYDAKHGWYTEWPRIRKINNNFYLMTMHGMFWQFPEQFSLSNLTGIRPLSSYLKIISDFCYWNDRIVMGCDDASVFDKKFVLQPQSNFWFVKPEELYEFGPKNGFGAVWMNENTNALEPSEPYLLAGFDKRMVHLAHKSNFPVEFILEVSDTGNNQWEIYKSVRVPAKGYAYYIFPENLTKEWIRVKTSKDCFQASAYFIYSQNEKRLLQNNSPVYTPLTNDTSVNTISYGFVRPTGHNTGKLQFLANIFDNNGKVRELGNYEIDEKIRFLKLIDSENKHDLKKDIPINSPDYMVDKASVLIIDKSGQIFRLPKGNPSFDLPSAAGWPRGIREVVTERSLFNAHGTMYELPRDNSGGFAGIKPICTHNRFIYDFCSWRGLLVISGNLGDAIDDQHYFKSATEPVGLWFGTVDDLWAMGKPQGVGGPWKDTPVRIGSPSDPYLMTGYDQKSVTLSHDSNDAVTFTIQIDITRNGDWQTYTELQVPAGQTVKHIFPEGYSAHWVRVVSDVSCSASAIFYYN